MRKFEVVDDAFRQFPEDTIRLPERKTKYSAGYDFYLPCNVMLNPGETISIPTDVKVRMDYRDVLKIYIRSSVGIKKGIGFANFVPIIDSDYYDNKTTGGNIILALHNFGDKIVYLTKGDAVAQGIFEAYSITEDDYVTAERTGGIGSTDKNN